MPTHIHTHARTHTNTNGCYEYSKNTQSHVILTDKSFSKHQQNMLQAKNRKHALQTPLTPRCFIEK